jgi:dTDP-4-dehydrorhamnose reductase
MRILVTGVTGQVGGALVGPLSGIGTVLAADRRALDLSDPGSLSEALGRLAPDLIVNPAAYTAVDRAEDERELAFRVNAEAPGAVARGAFRSFISRRIMCLTAQEPSRGARIDRPAPCRSTA